MLYSDHKTLYESNTLPIKNPSLQELLLYNMVDPPSFFSTPLVHTTIPIISTKPTLQQIFTFLFQLPTCLQNHPRNIHQHYLPLYLTFFYIPIFTYRHPYNLHQKNFSLLKPLSQFSLRQGSSEQGSLVGTDPCFDLSLLSRSMSKG